MLRPDLVKVPQTRKQNRLTFGNSGKQVLSCRTSASPPLPPRPSHQTSSVAKEETLGHTRPFLGQSPKAVMCRRGGRGRLDCRKQNVKTGGKLFVCRKWKAWLVESSLYVGSGEAGGSADPVGKTDERGGCRAPGGE